MCIDIDASKIDRLNSGEIPIYEPGLGELVERNMKAGRLKFSTDAEAGIRHGIAIFNAVGTPPDRDNENKADLKFVKAVAKTFGQHINEYKVFINKSTVPVGTGKMCEEIIKREIYAREKDTEFDVASNPEFLREGTAVQDFLSPDRIVLGSETSKAKKILDEIYRPFERTHTEILHTDITSAELIKYAANCFLATKISFINEIANFSEIAGANIRDIAKWLGMDPRIWKNFLSAGLGYGGSCLPKDVKALIETGKDMWYDFKIIQGADRVNELQKKIAVKKLEKALWNIEGKIISLWGLAFKPETDDVREAVSMTVIDDLLELWAAEIRVFDPVAMESMKFFGNRSDNIIYCESNYQTLEDSDALMLLTEWDEFLAPDWKSMKKMMRWNLVLDGRNIWNKEIVQEYWFEYLTIGQ